MLLFLSTTNVLLHCQIKVFISEKNRADVDRKELVECYECASLAVDHEVQGAAVKEEDENKVLFSGLLEVSSIRVVLVPIFRQVLWFDLMDSV
ncbi:hypothetical protein TURU_099032 [Turdus rufiventris]|nr:hypothetical protein TURU_099032 [Turdus rufiventris]